MSLTIDHLYDDVFNYIIKLLIDDVNEWKNLQLGMKKYLIII